MLTLVVPAGIAVAAGTFGIPHNDDFAFSAAALDFRRTGGFHLGGDEQMVLIGHVLWGQPFLLLFGGGISALHVAGLVAAAVGLGATFMMLRRLAGPGTALLGTACVALLPGYALLAGSFTTDVTAFAAQMVCLALALAALDRHGHPRAALLALSCAAGVAAFSSRQTAVPALVAVAATALWQSAIARRTRTEAAVDLAVVTAAFAAVVALAMWRFGLAGARPPSADATVSNLFAVLAAVSTMALFAAPLSLPLARSLLARPGGRRAGVLAGIALLPWLSLPLGGRDLLLGNLFTRRGANDGVIGGAKPDVFPPLAWAGLQGLALLALFGLLVWCSHGLTDTLPRLRRWMAARHDDASGLLLGLFTVLALAAAMAPAGRGANIFDRYLWPAAAGAVALLVRRSPDRSWDRRPAAAALSVLAVVAVATAVSISESISFDRARWSAGEQAVQTGVPADLVDAGYEWTGHHAPRPLRGTGDAEAAGAVTWWSRVYSPGLPCVVVLASPLVDERYALERRPSYDPVLSPRRRLFVYRRIDPCPDR